MTVWVDSTKEEFDRFVSEYDGCLSGAVLNTVEPAVMRVYDPKISEDPDKGLVAWFYLPYNPGEPCRYKLRGR